MTQRWSAPAAMPPNRTAYVDWWHETERDPARAGDTFGLINVRAGLQDPDAQARTASPVKGSDGGAARLLAEQAFGSNDVPIALHAKNQPLGDDLPLWQTTQITDRLPDDIEPDTVLVGIVDTGIALGHQCFRRADGRSRFIAAWQQNATWQHQDYLPFGQELYAADIDAALKTHSINGRLDEPAFNTALRLVEPALKNGQRDLDFHAAHGTHVLDLAAGFDPALTDDRLLARNRIIAVNLPPQSAHGTAGNFLAYWAIYAMERIFAVADALWERNKHRYGNPAVTGYPIVINFSYGMQAGPKDGASLFERRLEQLLDDRAARAQAPARVVMPVGNENLDKGHARAFMGGEAKWKDYDLLTELSVPLRILPNDHTSNFVEIWTSAMDTGGPLLQPDPEAFELAITPPGQGETVLPPLQKGQVTQLGAFARVYCPDNGARTHFVLCIAPTAQHRTDAALAPAGLWTLVVRYRGQAINVSFHVQSDQSGQRQSLTARQAYLDHARATSYREDGRLRDSYDYPTGTHEDSWPDYGPVQIKGTQNALATSTRILTVGGYRVSDGRPALYSGTMDGSSRRAGEGREVIDACYPSEITPSLFGMLAAGARDGAMVAFRGTSMAAGLATRDVAQALRQWDRADPDPTLADPKWLKTRAGALRSSADLPSHYVLPKGLKAGVGQIPAPPNAPPRRISRL